ncbi:MAG: class I SAM-dependent methyltransferase [Candidatus Shapirobacteria bacterium]|jgi:ubiquinone/menaquinone biosynthesis C-methylase UbiE
MSFVEKLEKRRIRKSSFNENKYNLEYFKGIGSNYPDNGAYLDLNSDYRFRFIDMSQWISHEMGGFGCLVDVAGGPGNLGYWMKKVCPKINVVHADYSMEALLYSKNTYPHSMVRLSCDNLPFNSDFADGILFADVLEHLEPEQAVKSIIEAKRVLNNDGQIFINIPNRNTWTRKTFDEPSHLWIPTQMDMRQGLSEIGFRKIKISTRGFPWSSQLRNVLNSDVHLPVGGTSIFIQAFK